MSEGRIGRREFLVAGAAMAAFAAGARAQDAAPSADADAAAAGGKTVKVTVKDIAFDPAEIEVHVGDTIEWDNQDPVAHTATVDGKWDVVFEPGETGTHVVTADDSVQYYCRFHPNMIGKITVLS